MIAEAIATRNGEEMVSRHVRTLRTDEHFSSKTACSLDSRNANV